ncbi:MAG: spore cortex biosynthesis protein YabQ [Brevibacillus sp.]|nr:spore cortex biosynthesis protein YabQ [Brevibacillus sp.]
MSIAVQLQTIALMSACGALMGMGFDTYQLFRRRWRIPAWLIFVLDVSFWVTSVLLVFAVLQRVNDGVVRWPIFLGIIAGAWLYFVLGSKSYTQFLLSVIKFVKWLYLTIMKIIDILIVQPILFVYKLLSILFGFLFTVLLTLGSFLWKLVLFAAQPFAGWGRLMGRHFSRSAAGISAHIKKWLLPKKKR